jgi:RNA polymerase sigma-70 factor, ECF subfamily
MVKAEIYAGLVPPLDHRPVSVAAPDAELIARIATADDQAMSALVARHSVRVFRYVMRIVDDRTLAEDVVSDVFFEVWQQAHKFEARSKVSTWILAIARNKAMSLLRHRRVHQDLDQAHDIADPTENAETTWHRANRDRKLRDCLMKLPPNHREVIDLVYYHEEPIEAVAKIVGIPLNTVKTRMYYARKHLASLLAEAGINHAVL